MTTCSANLVVRDLALRMQAAKEATATSETPQVVFVLGAGCSMQYQFPGFTELLEHIHRRYCGPLTDASISPSVLDEMTDHVRTHSEEALEFVKTKLREARPSPQLTFDDLRAAVDEIWKIQGPVDRQNLLAPHFPNASGANCPAYLRLADLACRGYIRAIVNMNFDSLLDEALSAIMNIRGLKNPFWRYMLDPSSATKMEKNAGEIKVEIYAPHGKLEAPLLTPEKPEPPPLTPEAVPVDPSGDHRGDLPGMSNDSSSWELQLDIAESALFKASDLQPTTNLLTQNHVIIIGYSGRDAKLAQVLIGNEGQGQKDRKLYVINVEGPGHLLPQILRARRSEKLQLTGNNGSFESFLEELYTEIARRPGSPPRSDSGSALETNCHHHASHSDRLVLRECRDLANRVRSSLGGSEAEPGYIEKHAEQIFEMTLGLATAAKVSLTPPEKFLLHAAGYLHDLGHFWGWSGLPDHELAGHELLNTHGERTVRLLLTGFLAPEPCSSLREELVGASALTPRWKLIPSSYTRQSLDVLFNTLMFICEQHSGLSDTLGSLHLSHPEIQQSVTMYADIRASRDSGDYDDEMASQNGLKMPLLFRPILLARLFAAAEQLSGDHGFFLVKDPVIPQRQRDLQLIDDPILELCEDRETRFGCEFSTSRVIVGNIEEFPPTGPTRCRPYSREWQLTRARIAIDDLNRSILELSMDTGSNSVTSPSLGTSRQGKYETLELFRSKDDSVPFPPPESRSDQEAAKVAVKELLDEAIQRQPLMTRVDSRLDLLAIYTLQPPVASGAAPRNGFRRHESTREPRLDRQSILQHIEELRQSVRDETRIPHTGVLYHYFLTLDDLNNQPLLRAHFEHDFNEILYPSWRFCARSWRRGIDKINMARASLEFGTSAAREEFVPGLHHLFPSALKQASRPFRGFCAHRGCIACTSRLLYILVQAKELTVGDRSFDRLRFEHPETGRGLALDDLIERILLFLLSDRIGEFDWFGLAYDSNVNRSRILSARYLSWALRALVSLSNFDKEFRRIARRESRKYHRQLRSWNKLMSQDTEERLKARISSLWRLLISQRNLVQQPEVHRQTWPAGSRFEEPAEYILGDVALAYLYIARLPHFCRRYSVPRAARMALSRALDELKFKDLHDLGRFYAWPALFLLTEDREDAWPLIVDTYVRCSYDNPIWIREGRDKGSWGYNVEPSQRVATSLTDFWLHALSPENRGRYEALFRSHSDLRRARPRR